MRVIEVRQIFVISVLADGAGSQKRQPPRSAVAGAIMSFFRSKVGAERNKAVQIVSLFRFRKETRVVREGETRL